MFSCSESVRWYDAYMVLPNGPLAPVDGVVEASRSPAASPAVDEGLDTTASRLHVQQQLHMELTDSTQSSCAANSFHTHRALAALQGRLDEGPGEQPKRIGSPYGLSAMVRSTLWGEEEEEEGGEMEAVDSSDAAPPLRLFSVHDPTRVGERTRRSSAGAATTTVTSAHKRRAANATVASAFADLPATLGVSLEAVLCPVLPSAPDQATTSAAPLGQTTAQGRPGSGATSAQRLLMASSHEVFAFVTRAAPQRLCVFDQLNDLPISVVPLAGATLLPSGAKTSAAGSSSASGAARGSQFPSVTALQSVLSVVPAACSVDSDDAVRLLTFDPSGYFVVVGFASGKAAYVYIPRRTRTPDASWEGSPMSSSAASPRSSDGAGVEATQTTAQQQQQQLQLQRQQRKEDEKRRRKEWKAAAKTWATLGLHAKSKSQRAARTDGAESPLTLDGEEDEDGDDDEAYRPTVFSLAFLCRETHSRRRERALQRQNDLATTARGRAGADADGPAVTAAPWPFVLESVAWRRDGNGVSQFGRASSSSTTTTTTSCELLLGARQGGVILCCQLTSDRGPVRTRVVYAFPSPHARQPIDAILCYVAPAARAAPGSLFPRTDSGAARMADQRARANRESTDAAEEDDIAAPHKSPASNQGRTSVAEQPRCFVMASLGTNLFAFAGDGRATASAAQERDGGNAYFIESAFAPYPHRWTAQPPGATPEARGAARLHNYLSLEDAHDGWTRSGSASGGGGASVEGRREGPGGATLTLALPDELEHPDSDDAEQLRAAHSAGRAARRNPLGWNAADGVATELPAVFFWLHGGTVLVQGLLLHGTLDGFGRAVSTLGQREAARDPWADRLVSMALARMRRADESRSREAGDQSGRASTRASRRELFGGVPDRGDLSERERDGVAAVDRDLLLPVAVLSVTHMQPRLRALKRAARAGAGLAGAATGAQSRACESPRFTFSRQTSSTRHGRPSGPAAPWMDPALARGELSDETFEMLLLLRDCCRAVRQQPPSSLPPVLQRETAPAPAPAPARRVVREATSTAAALEENGERLMSFAASYDHFVLTTPSTLYVFSHLAALPLPSAAPHRTRTRRERGEHTAAVQWRDMLLYTTTLPPPRDARAAGTILFHDSYFAPYFYIASDEDAQEGARVTRVETTRSYVTRTFAVAELLAVARSIEEQRRQRGGRHTGACTGWPACQVGGDYLGCESAHSRNDGGRAAGKDPRQPSVHGGSDDDYPVSRHSSAAWAPRGTAAVTAAAAGARRPHRGRDTEYEDDEPLSRRSGTTTAAMLRSLPAGARATGSSSSSDGDDDDGLLGARALTSDGRAFTAMSARRLHALSSHPLPSSSSSRSSSRSLLSRSSSSSSSRSLSSSWRSLPSASHSVASESNWRAEGGDGTGAVGVRDGREPLTRTPVQHGLRSRAMVTRREHTPPLYDGSLRPHRPHRHGPREGMGGDGFSRSRHWNDADARGADPAGGSAAAAAAAAATTAAMAAEALSVLARNASSSSTAAAAPDPYLDEASVAQSPRSPAFPTVPTGSFFGVPGSPLSTASAAPHSPLLGGGSFAAGAARATGGPLPPRPNLSFQAAPLLHAAPPGTAAEQPSGPVRVMSGLHGDTRDCRFSRFLERNPVYAALLLHSAAMTTADTDSTPSTGLTGASSARGSGVGPELGAPERHAAIAAAAALHTAPTRPAALVIPSTGTAPGALSATMPSARGVCSGSFYAADHLYEMALRLAASTRQHDFACSRVLLDRVRHAYGSFLLREDRHLEAAAQLGRLSSAFLADSITSFSTLLIEMVRVARREHDLLPLLLLLRLRLQSCEEAEAVGGGGGGTSLFVDCSVERSVLATLLVPVLLERCADAGAARRLLSLVVRQESSSARATGVKEDAVRRAATQAYRARADAGEPWLSRRQWLMAKYHLLPCGESGDALGVADLLEDVILRCRALLDVRALAPALEGIASADDSAFAQELLAVQSHDGAAGAREPMASDGATEALDGGVCATLLLRGHRFHAGMRRLQEYAGPRVVPSLLRRRKLGERGEMGDDGDAWPASAASTTMLPAEKQGRSTSRSTARASVLALESVAAPRRRSSLFSTGGTAGPAARAAAPSGTPEELLPLAVRTLRAKPFLLYAVTMPALDVRDEAGTAVRRPRTHSGAAVGADGSMNAAPSVGARATKALTSASPAHAAAVWAAERERSLVRVSRPTVRLTPAARARLWARYTPFLLRCIPVAFVRDALVPLVSELGEEERYAAHGVEALQRPPALHELRKLLPSLLLYRPRWNELARGCEGQRAGAEQGGNAATLPSVLVPVADGQPPRASVAPAPSADSSLVTDGLDGSVSSFSSSSAASRPGSCWAGVLPTAVGSRSDEWATVPLFEALMHEALGAGEHGATLDAAVALTLVGMLVRHGGDAQLTSMAEHLSNVEVGLAVQQRACATGASAAAASARLARLSERHSLVRAVAAHLYRCCHARQRFLGCAWALHVLGHHRDAQGVSLAVLADVPLAVLLLQRQRRRYDAMASATRTPWRQAVSAVSQPPVDADSPRGEGGTRLVEEKERAKRRALWRELIHCVLAAPSLSEPGGPAAALGLIAGSDGDINLTDVLPELSPSVRFDKITADLLHSVGAVSEEIHALQSSIRTGGQEAAVLQRDRWRSRSSHVALSAQTQRCALCRQLAFARPFVSFPRCCHVMHVSCYNSCRQTLLSASAAGARAHRSEARRSLRDSDDADDVTVEVFELDAADTESEAAQAARAERTTLPEGETADTLHPPPSQSGSAASASSLRECLLCSPTYVRLMLSVPLSLGVAGGSLAGSAPLTAGALPGQAQLGGGAVSLR